MSDHDTPPMREFRGRLEVLATASVAAREAGPVDPGVFDRAGEPVHLHEPADEASDAEVWVGGSEPACAQAAIPRLSYTPQLHSFPTWPQYVVEPLTIVEPYAIERWAEKSTMNDVLGPIARQHGVSFIASVGELSLSHCHQLKERVSEHRRATRILYISDFDASGDGMPVSIARKIEFLLRRDGLGLDFRLDPLVLTSAQVRRYRLPRIRSRAATGTRIGLRIATARGLSSWTRLRLCTQVSCAGSCCRRSAPTASSPASSAARSGTPPPGSSVMAIRSVKVCWQCRASRSPSCAPPMTPCWRRSAGTRRRSPPSLPSLRPGIKAEAHEHVEAINAATVPFYERAAELFEAISAKLWAETPDAAAVEWPEPCVADESDDQLFQSERGYLEQIAQTTPGQADQPAGAQRQWGRAMSGTRGIVVGAAA